MKDLFKLQSFLISSNVSNYFLIRVGKAVLLLTITLYMVLYMGSVNLSLNGTRM